MSTGDYKMLINGQLVSADETFDVINPASEAVIAGAPQT
jgi:acyl-CoA reductase-like NAD-dependent aldehyde dehydrogenase